MSCRALGLGIEEAFLAQIANQLQQQGATAMAGRLLKTEANLASCQLYRQNGFAQDPNRPLLWSRSLANPLVPPPHVSFADRLIRAFVHAVILAAIVRLNGDFRRRRSSAAAKQPGREANQLSHEGASDAQHAHKDREREQRLPRWIAIE
jgi:hypothetical protein